MLTYKRHRSLLQLSQILHAILLCLLSPLIGGASAAAVADSITVRRLAAHTLSAIISTSLRANSTAAWTASVEVLQTTLQQPNLPMTTLIGAVLGAQHLGPDVIEKVVVPVAGTLIRVIRISLQEKHFKSKDILEREAQSTKEYVANLLLDLLLSITTPPG